ncbi:MAG TPA: alanine--tRNA ligase, partial [Terriglobales bacterium]
MLSGNEIRRRFLDYFVQRGHKEVHSSSLVPANDPTLLFTNAGMNQFKDVFLGLEKRDYNLATTSQKCVRAGGKHNDLENVGFTNRHHTFFEMLGNFSFGDYFKREAIAYAWELITSPEWYAIPKDKLYATIFKGEGVVPRDEEAYNFWLEQGVPKERIFEFGLKDNFWQMGDTGPCGPCSELHYDMGPAASDQGHADCKFGCECGRYIEIWNLVFMQFDRDAAGILNPLPKPSIDTGAGLERITAVLQGVLSNYDTDLFRPLIKRAAELCNISLVASRFVKSRKDVAASLRVIADHARATTFLITDGVLPSNEGRGYVLRKIMRRAILHGRRQDVEKPFLHEMVYSVRDLMKDAYPELVENAERVAKIVLGEEKRFAHTLGVGLGKLEEDFRPLWAEKFLAENPGQTLEEVKKNFGGNITAADWGGLAPKKRPIYRGDKAFRLYETFGLPRDFIEDACRDSGFSFDEAGFEQAMQAERARAQASWKGEAKRSANPVYFKIIASSYSVPLRDGGFEIIVPQQQSVFEGYRATESSNCRILAIVRYDKLVSELKKSEQGEVILDHTPFYAESGGQVADRGWLYSPGRGMVVAEVEGCYYPVQGVRAHQVVAREDLHVGDRVDAVVDTDKRWATMRHHTATHLLHAGLRQVLGPHVKQAGSLVSPGRLRFDFSHFVG